MPHWKTIYLSAGLALAFAFALPSHDPETRNFSRHTDHKQLATDQTTSSGHPDAAITISGIVNDYTPVLSFSNCDSSVLLVGSAVAFAPDDKVLIIQMKGATVNLSNSASFGDIVSPGNAGNYEFNRIKSISGNQITLLYKVEKSYNVAGKVQLIRVPEYSDVTADGLTCQPWDGTTGGVLAIDVAGTLTVQGGDIDVSAKGFRGGVVVNSNNPAYHQTGYFFRRMLTLPVKKAKGSLKSL